MLSFYYLLVYYGICLRCPLSRSCRVNHHLSGQNIGWSQHKILLRVAVYLNFAFKTGVTNKRNPNVIYAR